MSLLQSFNRNDYVGNGATATYSFTFRIQESSQLKVIKIDLSNVETNLTLTTDFTVSGVGAANGGTITLVAGNLPTGYKLAILRVVPLTQLTDIRNQGAFYPEIHEDVFDRLTAIDQQQQDAIDRSLRLPASINPSVFDMELPSSVVANPDATIIVNATGDGLAVGPTSTAVANASANAIAAAASASAASTSEINAAASAAAAAASAAAGAWTDVVFCNTAGSPYTLTNASQGKFYVVDATAGNVVINLPQISGLTLTQGWALGIKKSDSSANTVTINANGSDLIDGASSISLARQNFGATLLPDLDPSPDAWTAVLFGDVRNLYSPTIYTPIIDVSTLTGQGSTPASPSAGSYKSYVKTADSKMYLLNSSGVETQIGSGSGGGVNYITNPDAESATSGWATYADAAASIPVDGTGGAPSITWTRTTTSPLRGLGSFLLTKDAVNRQGQGVSYDFTIDQADKNTVIRCAFEYQIASGSYADDVLEVFVYDVTNAAIIYCSPSKIKNSSLNEKFQLEFQTSSSTSYRLIIHTASTSTSAFTMKFDNFSLGPIPKAVGSVITGWRDYTPTSQGFGTITVLESKWRRVGSDVEIRVKFNAGTTTASEARIGLPNVTTNVAGQVICGSYEYSAASGATDIYGLVLHADVSQQYLTFGTGSSTVTSFTKRPGNNLGGITSGVAVSLTAKVPVSGWDATQIMSNDADTRIVAMSASGTIADVTANNPMIFATVLRDTHGAYNTTTGQYTCQSTGWYQIESSVSAGGTTTARIHTYINGTLSKQIGMYTGTGTQMLTAAGLEYLTVGQTLDLRPNAAIAGFATTGSLSIFKLTGPSQIAASEKIYASFGIGTIGLATTALTTINFPTVYVDSHAAYSAGTYTIMSAGFYQILASEFYASSNDYLLVYKNGTNVGTCAYCSNTSGITGAGSYSAYFVPGDQITIRTQATNTIAYSAGSYRLKISIVKL